MQYKNTKYLFAILQVETKEHCFFKTISYLDQDMSFLAALEWCSSVLFLILTRIFDPFFKRVLFFFRFSTKNQDQNSDQKHKQKPKKELLGV